MLFYITTYKCTFHRYAFIDSRSDQKPKRLAHKEPCHESRDVVRVVSPERANREPLEAYAHALPKAAGRVEEVVSGRAVYMRERQSELSEEF